MYGTPGAISGSVTREGLRAALERKASLLLGGFGSPAATGDHSAGGVGRRIRAALFTASFESSRQPQNAFEVAVGLRPSFSGKLVRVNYNFYQGFKVDCDRFLIELRCVYPGQGVLRLTPGVANLLEEIYSDGYGGMHGILTSLVSIICPAITDDVVDRLLHHIRLLEGVQSCACGRAFVYGGPPEACDTCLLRASSEALSEVVVCAICRDDAHTSFAFKCPDCSCLLHQSCLFKLWDCGPYGSPKCPQCRRKLKRPAEVGLTLFF